MHIYDNFACGHVKLLIEGEALRSLIAVIASHLFIIIVLDLDTISLVVTFESGNLSLI